VFAADFLAPVLVFAAVFLAAVFAPEVFLAVFFFVVAEVFFAAILKHFPFKNNC
jgi:4-hydroxybenzoate polyprenyltransferase